MGWDYAYGINGQALSDYALMTRVASEIASAPKGDGLVLPFHDGMVEGLYRPSRVLEIEFEVLLRYTNAAGSVVHVDGEAGHVYENRSAILQLFGDTSSRRWLQRTAPDQGAVEIPFRLSVSPANSRSIRHLMTFFMRTYDAFWREQTQRTGVNPIPTITVDGNAPVGDAVYTFSGMNGVQRLTNSDTGDFIEVNTDTTVTSVIVDLLAGTVTQGGSPVPTVVEFSGPRGIWLWPGVNNMALSGTGSVAVDLYEKWR